MTTSTRTRPFSIVGIGAAACVACCAGPILAILGGLGAAGLLSSLAVGVAGLALAGVAVLARALLRRRRTDHCSLPTDHPAFRSEPTG